MVSKSVPVLGRKTRSVTCNTSRVHARRSEEEMAARKKLSQNRVAKKTLVITRSSRNIVYFQALTRAAHWLSADV